MSSELFIQLMAGFLGVIVTGILAYVAKEIHTLGQSVNDLNVKLSEYMADSRQHSKSLEDHEKRIRDLEQKEK